MAQIPYIDDLYINEIIKAEEAYNPDLNKTQGVKLRELIKRLRDRAEQGGDGVVRLTGDQNITGTKSFIQISTEEISLLKNGYTSVLKNALDQAQNNIYTLPKEGGEFALKGRITKSDVGMGNVDNTADINKPVSTATQSALDGKANASGSNATGTWSIDITGKAAKADAANLWGGRSANFDSTVSRVLRMVAVDHGDGSIKQAEQADVLSFLGLPPTGETWTSVMSRNPQLKSTGSSFTAKGNLPHITNNGNSSDWRGLFLSGVAETDTFIGGIENNDDFVILTQFNNQVNFRSVATTGDANIRGSINMSGNQLNLYGGTSEIVNRSGPALDLYGSSHSLNMRLMTNGNVGVGVETPIAKLDIAGVAGFNTLRLSKASNNAPSIEFAGASTSTIIEAGDDFNIYTNGIPRQTVLKNGNVGIGTTTPTEKLSVQGKVSVSSAPTNPTDVVRLNEISGGKSIDVNAVNATKWNGALGNLNTAASAPSKFAVYDDASNQWAYATPTQIKTILNIDVASGSYNPVFTGFTNINSVTGGIAHYTKVGNRVTVYGSVSLIPSAANNTQTLFKCTLPISPNFRGNMDLLGMCTINSVAEPGFPNMAVMGLIADYSNQLASFSFFSRTASNCIGYFQFTYISI